MPTKSGVSAPEDIEAITSASHPDPFSVLGIHPFGNGFVARCFIPVAESVVAFASGRKVGELTRRNKSGFFDGLLTLRERQPLVYVATGPAASATAAALEWRVP